MLVLSRRIGEQLCIGQGVVVTIVAIQGGRVRIGVDAPAAVRVARPETGARAAKFAGVTAGAHAHAEPG